MAENKSEKLQKEKNVRKYKGQNYREYRNFGDNSLLLGIGIGTILLVLAEICCIFAGIYNMVSPGGSIAVIVTSALLLLGTTGVFLYILKNTLVEKMNEQRQTYEKLIQMNKMAYGKMEERDEKLYKRQLSIAKVQIKRTRESVMNMVRANEYIIDVIEEKLGEDSAFSSYGAALSEVQESVEQLRGLCEKIAEGQAGLPEQPEMLPEPEEELPELAEELPELAEELPELEEELPELTEMLPEPEEPAGVEIEPLPEEILEKIGGLEIEAAPAEPVSEPEIELGEFLPEIEIPDEEEFLSEPEITEEDESLPEPEIIEEDEFLSEPEITGEDEFLPEIEEPEEEAPPGGVPVEEEEDPGKPMSVEDIAALFSNL